MNWNLQSICLLATVIVLFLLVLFNLAKEKKRKTTPGTKKAPAGTRSACCTGDCRTCGGCR